ncbi:hypothetical protein ACIA5H_36400 [Nocardia sp. NPDC051900]
MGFDAETDIGQTKFLADMVNRSALLVPISRPESRPVSWVAAISAIEA